MKAREFLTEMIIRTNKGSNSGYVIAFKDSIWIIDPKENLSRTQEEKILQDIKTRTGMSANSLQQLINNSGIDDYYRPDVLFAEVIEQRGKKYLVLNNEITQQNPRTSSLVKKVVQTLNIDEVIYNQFLDIAGTMTSVYDKKGLVGDIPSTLFHGTSSKYIDSILSKGIQPSENANWDVKVPNTVFLTSDPHYAAFHALNTTINNKKSFPIVIEVKVPDMGKITLDFDTVTSAYGSDHPDLDASPYAEIIQKERSKEEKQRLQTIRKFQKGTNINTQLGNFGYKGRIPPTHLLTFYTPFNHDASIDDWYYFESKEEFKRALTLFRKNEYYDPDWELEQ